MFLPYTRPTSWSERLFEEALVMKGLIVLPFGFSTQIAKKTRVVISVRISDYMQEEVMTTIPGTMQQ